MLECSTNRECSCAHSRLRAAGRAIDRHFRPIPRQGWPSLAIPAIATEPADYIVDGGAFSGPEQDQLWPQVAPPAYTLRPMRYPTSGIAPQTPINTGLSASRHVTQITRLRPWFPLLPRSSKTRPVRMAAEPLSRSCRAMALPASFACAASNRSRARIGSCSPGCTPPR